MQNADILSVLLKQKCGTRQNGKCAPPNISGILLVKSCKTTLNLAGVSGLVESSIGMVSESL